MNEALLKQLSSGQSDEIIEWRQQLKSMHFPRWNELPQFDLYSEQVVQYIRELLWFIDSDENPIITKAMINNYVKGEYMPKPIKKKYNRLHIAHIIGISILKQVVSIQEVDMGMSFYLAIADNEDAFNAFADTINFAFHDVLQQMETNKRTAITYPYPLNTIHFAAYAFINKLIVTRITTMDLKKYLDSIIQNRDNA